MNLKYYKDGDVKTQITKRVAKIAISSFENIPIDSLASWLGILVEGIKGSYKYTKAFIEELLSVDFTTKSSTI